MITFDVQLVVLCAALRMPETGVIPVFNPWHTLLEERDDLERKINLPPRRFDVLEQHRVCVRGVPGEQAESNDSSSSLGPSFTCLLMSRELKVVQHSITTVTSLRSAL